MSAGIVGAPQVSGRSAYGSSRYAVWFASVPSRNSFSARAFTSGESYCSRYLTSVPTGSSISPITATLPTTRSFRSPARSIVCSVSYSSDWSPLGSKKPASNTVVTPAAHSFFCHGGIDFRYRSMPVGSSRP